jgi:hypothetical protein
MQTTRVRTLDPHEPRPNEDSTRPPRETEEPWPVDITGHDAPHCDCAPAPTPPPKPPCTRSVQKDNDCCERLIALLGGDRPNAGRTKIHKPKTPPKVKLANWCCDWPVKDAAGPLMVLISERATKGLTPKNEFEKTMYCFFDTLDARHRKALQIGIDAYKAIPEGRRCGFETRIDDWPDDVALDPAFIAKVILKEVVDLGRYGVFGVSPEEVRPGEIRLWDQTTPLQPDGGGGKTLKAPWPWICAVNPGADDVKWYRNRDVVVPDKSDIAKVKFNAFEFGTKCTTAVDPKNPKNVVVNCADTLDTSNPFASCDGGTNYLVPDSSTGRTRCLSIPLCVAGQGVALRGFNYVSFNSTVVIKKVGGGFPDMKIKADVMADPKPDTKSASCSIRDVATFTIPRAIPDGLNDLNVPPGRYTVEIHVPNESHYAPEAGPAPSEFVSNTAFIDIVPPLDIPFQVWFTRGNCYEETDGLGSDEPWFRSYTATYRAVGSDVVATKSQDIFKQEDIDSGDWIGFTPVTAFSGKFEIGGVVAIAVQGLEVDSEDAAKEPVTSFGEAYGLYWKQVFTILAGGGATGLLGKGIAALIDGAGITGSLIAGGIALIVIAAAGLFFAAWAPADPIAYDLLIYDPVNLFLLTSPGAALPLSDAGNIGGITWSSLPTGFNVTSATSAEYMEERQYRADDEGSHYGLNLKLNQLPP